MNIKTKTENKTNYLVYLLMAITIYFVFFQQLDSFQIRTWDESTYAVNAYEMKHNGNYITPYLKGVPDNSWNTKPPLIIWSQLIFINILGFNELAVRLPSAIACTITAILIFGFINKRFGLLFAASSFFVYCSCMGVSTFHTGRTGDSDALFSLFFIAAVFEFYKWLFESKEKSIFVFFVYISLAYLTNSLAVLSVFPAVVVLVLLHKKVKICLSSKWFYEGVLLFLFIALGYIYVRNIEGAYVKGIISNELNKMISANAEQIDFYFNNLFNNQFSWIFLVIPGALLMFKNNDTKPLFVFLSLFFVSHFVIYSLSSVKLYWYMMPVFALLAMVASYVVVVLIEAIEPSKRLKQSVFYLVIISLFPLYFAARQSYKSDLPEGKIKDEALAKYAFKNKNSNTLDSVVFFTTNFDLPLVFYKYVVNEKGMNFEIRNNINYISSNTEVIVSEELLVEQLKSRFDIELVEEVDFVKRFKIKNRIETN